ncbi:MAG: GntR family transcriptional regulator [Candidatus Pelethousia sp.]|nr:GntR family transcriptional regulator [Candidatus Pelethousia sp.]
MPAPHMRQSDREFAYSTIRAAICNGEIPPGERIVETVYANMLSLSRTPIREAIRMLVQEGLIEFIPKRGAIARRLPSDDLIDQIYSIRKAIQLAFADRTITRMSEAQLAAMDACNQACLEALAIDDMERFFANYDRSNCILQEGAQAPIAAAILEQMNNYVPISSLSSGFSHSISSKLREIALPSRARREEATREHVLIATAIRSRDVQKLRASLALHTENAKSACFAGIHNLKKHYGIEAADGPPLRPKS